MGLFSLTKKPEEKKEAPKMPSFPQFPQAQEEEMPEFPAYEPTIGDIKKEITKPDDFDIPIRDKKTESKSMFATQIEQPKFTPPAKTESLKSGPAEQHTLFVKIDRYKEAMHDMQNLKTKIAEAEKILTSLEELKAEEDAKLSKWNSEVQEIKERLMSIDKNLFEA